MKCRKLFSIVWAPVTLFFGLCLGSQVHAQTPCQFSVESLLKGELKPHINHLVSIESRGINYVCQLDKKTFQLDPIRGARGFSVDSVLLVDCYDGQRTVVAKVVALAHYHSPRTVGTSTQYQFSSEGFTVELITSRESLSLTREAQILSQKLGVTICQGEPLIEYDPKGIKAEKRQHCRDERENLLAAIEPIKNQLKSMTGEVCVSK